MQNAVVQHMTAENSGSILVKNEGGYVIRFSIAYTFGGQRFSQMTEPYPVLQSRTLFIPNGATDIHLHTEISYVFGWGTIFTQIFPTPVVKCYKVWGTAFEPQWTEIGC